jgi:ribose transport system permease protein
MLNLRRLLRRYSFMFALVLAVALMVANVIALPAFGAPHNWTSDLRLFAPFVLVAMASTPAIISGGGGLDISVGPTATLINVVLVAKMLGHGVGSPGIAIPLLLLLGAAVGLVNGFLIAVLRYTPVIATLCMFFVLGGVALLIAPTAITPGQNWTNNLGGNLGPVPGPLLLIIGPILLWVLLGRTPYIRALYAVGSSDATAFSAGVNVTRVRILAYVLDGLFAGVAGIALTIVVGTGDATLATQYTLPAIAAVVLGGTPVMGGRGGMLGSVLGAATIFLLQNFLTSVHVASDWLQVAYGGLLLLSVVVGSLANLPGRARGVTA